jgi:hypothetical protein
MDSCPEVWPFQYQPLPLGCCPQPQVPVPKCTQHPIPPSITGTASHPVDLEQPTVEPEQPIVEPKQPPIDLDQYQWLFTKRKGEVKVALNVGLAKFQDAVEFFQNACAMHTIRMIGCRTTSLTWHGTLGYALKIWLME